MSSGSDLRRADLVYTTVAIVFAAVMVGAGVRAYQRPAATPARASAQSLFVPVSAASQAPPVHLSVRVAAADVPRPDPHVLRVCADPNNLPFSNDRGEGFENQIAAVVARDLGRRLDYYWQPQRRGFIRTTLKAGYCDLVVGVPSKFEMALPTRPYYRSTYVFVTRAGVRPVRSLDDPRLRRLRIGVEMTGEDYENPPAVQALAARHIIDNVRGYLVFGDYSQPNPPRRVIDAVALGQVDAAIAWGPLAGYFARRSTTPLVVTPVSPEQDGSALPFTFAIAMGVRRSDRALHDAVDAVIAKRTTEMTRILQRYGVPMLPIGGGS